MAAPIAPPPMITTSDCIVILCHFPRLVVEISSKLVGPPATIAKLPHYSLLAANAEA
jgi:hypothetical protein